MEFFKQLQAISQSADGEIFGLSGGFPWGYIWLGLILLIGIYLIYAHFLDWYNFDLKCGLTSSRAVLKTSLQMLGTYAILSPFWLTALLWIYGILIFHGDRQVTSIHWDSQNEKVNLQDNYYQSYSYPFSELSHILVSIPSEDKKAILSPNAFYSRMQNDETVSIELVTKGYEKFTLATFSETIFPNEGKSKLTIDNGFTLNRNSINEDLEKFAQLFSIPVYSMKDREQLFANSEFMSLLKSRGLKDSKEIKLLDQNSSATFDTEYVIEKKDFRKGFGSIFSYVGNLWNIAVLVFLPLVSWLIYNLTHVFERFKRFWARKIFGKIFTKMNQDYDKKDFWKSRFFIIMNLIVFFLAFGFIQSQDRARLLPAKISFSEPWFVYRQLEPGKDFNPNELTSIDFLVDVYLADPFKAWDRLRDLANLDFEKYQISYHNIETLYRPVFWQGENQISIKEVSADERNILFWDGIDPLVSEYLLYQIEKRMDTTKKQTQWSDR
jgi:hypothetical protein